MSKSTGSNDECFLILFFKTDNTFSVVNSKSAGCRNITATTAEMMHQNQWFTGEIKYKGKK